MNAMTNYGKRKRNWPKVLALLSLLSILTACSPKSLNSPDTCNPAVAYPAPEKPEIIWYECQPDTICLSHQDAAELFAWLLAIDRWTETVNNPTQE